MIEVEGIAAGRVLFVPNGIAARRTTPGRERAARAGDRPEAPVVGSVGALRAEKRFDVLLRAAAAACAEMAWTADRDRGRRAGASRARGARYRRSGSRAP